VNALPAAPVRGCAAVVTSVGRLEVCGPSSLRLAVHGRTIRFRPPPLVGLWTRYAISPNRRWLLLEGDVGCDTTGAYVVRASGGTPLPVPLPRPGCEEADVQALGWTSDGRARVRFTPEDCACSLKAGVHAVDPRTRQPAPR
jgi:hypothetical protein